VEENKNHHTHQFSYSPFWWSVRESNPVTYFHKSTD